MFKYLKRYLQVDSSEINGSTEFHAVKRDIDNIRSRIEKLEEQYNLYKEERAYTKKAAFEIYARKSSLRKLYWQHVVPMMSAKNA